ncbi:MAG: hypothetical protein M1366_03215 [Patescibacteria group bacterium]|nr:hypothetical protein [Patescibacteria group bacterium]
MKKMLPRSRKSSSMQKVSDILVKFNPLEDKYISREFQAYGYHLAEALNDPKHRALYMKLAKTLPRAVLEKALSYVSDANVKRKGALFMWKLKQLGAWQKEEKKKKKATDIPF